MVAGSVAAEDGKIEVGDVITHINSEAVLHPPPRYGTVLCEVHVSQNFAYDLLSKICSDNSVKVEAGLKLDYCMGLCILIKKKTNFSSYTV